MWNALTELALEHIVVPLVLLVINIIGPWVIDIVQYILLAFMVLPLWIIRFLEEGVDIFSGTASLSGGSGEGMTLIEYLMGQSVVTTVFWGITLISAALCIGFSIIAVVRSMGDLDVKRPVGKVLGSVGKAMLTFLIIPFMCIASIAMAGLVLRQVSLLIDTAGEGSEPVSVTGTLFVISANNETVPEFRWGELKWDSQDGFYFLEIDNWTSAQKTARYEQLRHEYMTGKRGTGWSDIPEMKENFHIFKLFYPGNAIVSILVSWFYVIMMCMILMIFLRRIYELLLLYLVSPFFVSVIPLDEGEKFKGWREQFISTVIAGFGSIFMLKIFIIFLPLIWDDNFRMHSNSFSNVVLKALLTAGGIYATYKSHTMITSIISEKAARAEQETAAFGKSLAFAPTKPFTKLANWGAGMARRDVENRILGQGRHSKGSKSGSKDSGSSGNKNPNMSGGKGGETPIDFSKQPGLSLDGDKGSKDTSHLDDLAGKETMDKIMGRDKEPDATLPLYQRDKNIQSLGSEHLKDMKDEREYNPFVEGSLVSGEIGKEPDTSTKHTPPWHDPPKPPDVNKDDSGFSTNPFEDNFKDPFSETTKPPPDTPQTPPQKSHQSKPLPKPPVQQKTDSNKE